MELTNEFRVPVPVDHAWHVLTDVERIAPCMPGAQLEEIEGDEYRGIVKVKVGPITAQYKGKATFVERDDEGHRAVLRAEGRGNQGNASATITALLTPEGDGTYVQVTTDLTVTGRVAQFGRGVMADVSAKLLGQFVACLETSVLAGTEAAGTDAADTGEMAPVESAETTPADTTTAEPSGTEPAAPGNPEPATDAPKVRKIDQPAAEPVVLLETAGGPIVKRVGPVVAVVALLWLLRQFLRRRRAG